MEIDRMKEFKGTQGPWAVCKDIDGEMVVIRKDSLEEGCGWKSYVGITKDIDCHHNANLIATAPELLKELQLLIIAIENLEGEPMTGLDHVHNRIEESQAAINKVLGDQ